jgi:hypothetical protein
LPLIVSILGFERVLKTREGDMADERPVDGLGGARPAVRVVPPRPAIMLRGAGYGFLAGVTGGAVLGGVLGFASGPAWAVPCAFFGGVVGGMAGLGAGVIGGVVFALSVPRLARHAVATRIAGAAVLPGALVLGWGLYAVWQALTGRAVDAHAGAVGMLLVPSAIGAVAGALVGPRVLYGKRPRGAGAVAASPLR